MSIDNQIITERSIYPRPLTFGKGVRGRLDGVVVQSQIPLIDYFNRRNQEAVKLGSAHIPTSLPREDGLQDMTDGEFSGFNKLFPRLVEAFLLNRKFYVEDLYLEGVPTGNSEHILPILFDMYQSSEKERNTGVVARIVFGASEEMSLRSLSYILPALLHMQHLQKETRITIPQLQLIFAKHTSGELNGLDERKVAKETLLFARVADAFIRKYFPSLRDRVVFLEDTPLHSEVYGRQLEEVACRLKQIDLALLEGKAARRNGAHTTTTYAAAHVLLHETAATEILRPLTQEGIFVFPDQLVLSPTGIINYGGTQELPFYALRQEGRSLPFLHLLPSIQFFTKHHVPPYFIAEGGDIGLREAIIMGREKREARREILAPRTIPNVTYQPRGKNGAVHEDLKFLEKTTDEQESDYKDTSPLDTFLDSQADTAKTI